MARLKSFLTTRKQIFLAFLCIPDNEFWKFRIDVEVCVGKRNSQLPTNPKFSCWVRRRQTNIIWVTQFMFCYLLSFSMVHRLLWCIVRCALTFEHFHLLLRNTQQISNNFGNIVSQSEGEQKFWVSWSLLPLPLSPEGWG